LLAGCTHCKLCVGSFNAGCSPRKLGFQLVLKLQQVLSIRALAIAIRLTTVIAVGAELALVIVVKVAAIEWVFATTVKVIVITIRVVITAIRSYSRATNL
jgi:hypothetical protein